MFGENDVNGGVMQRIRLIESGSTRGNYSIVNPSGAYGAYQMRQIALRDIGAISRNRSIHNPNDWTGRFGNSLEDFMTNPDPHESPHFC